MVSKTKIGYKPCPQISDAVVGVQVDTLVIHQAPESFDKDVDFFPYIGHTRNVETVALLAFKALRIKD